MASLVLLAGLNACASPPAGIVERLPRFGLDSALPRADVGTLELRLPSRGSPAPRRLMATTADVAYVHVRVSGQNVEVSANIDASGAGPLVHTFSALPAGPIRVELFAYDRADRMIGRKDLMTAIVANVTTPLTTTIPLLPTLANPRFLTDCGPNTGGTTGSVSIDWGAPTSGTARVPALVSQQLVDQDGMPDVADLAIHADGSLWVTGGPWWGLAVDYGTPNTHSGLVYRVPPGGTLQALPAPPVISGAYSFTPGEINLTSPTGRVAVAQSLDMQGSAYSSAAFFSFSADGQASQLYEQEHATSFVLDTDTSLWETTYHATDVTQYRLIHQTGLVPHVPGPHTVVRDLDPGKHPTGLLRDGAQHFWVFGRKIRTTAGGEWKVEGIWLQRLDPTGTTVANIEVPCGSGVEAALDSQDALWFVASSDGKVMKVSGTGATLAVGECALRPNRLYVDAHDEVWAYYGTKVHDGYYLDQPSDDPATEYVARFSSDGTLLAYYHVGSDVDITKVVVTGDGTMWVGTLAHGLIELQVDVPFAP